MDKSVSDFLNYASYESIDFSKKFINSDIEDLFCAIKNKQDCILYGPPGTGKTHLIDMLTDRISKEELGIVAKTQFHTNFSYENFIEGIVPDVIHGGFRYEDGIFFEFCQKASKISREKICLFIIDEINRANVTSVFGEVLNLIENKEDRKLLTSKTKRLFFVPSNVIIIGTMNTSDRTLSKLDFAFRRRFKFLPVFPSEEILSSLLSQSGFSPSIPFSIDSYVKCFSVLNRRILKHPLLGKNLMLGHALWVKKGLSGEYSLEDIYDIFNNSIFPQLESYCGTNRDVLTILVGSILSEKIINGYFISEDDIIGFVESSKNCKIQA